MAVHFIAKKIVRFLPEEGEVWGDGGRCGETGAVWRRRGAGRLRHDSAEHIFCSGRNPSCRTWSISPTTPSVLSRLLVGSSVHRPRQALHDLRNLLAFHVRGWGGGGRPAGSSREGPLERSFLEEQSARATPSVRLGGEEVRAPKAAQPPRGTAGTDPRRSPAQSKGPFLF